MKKILSIIVLALVFVWLVRPDFNFNFKKEHQPALSRADVPTVEQTISVEDISVLDEEEARWAETAIGLSERFSKNVILTFEEEGGWNERVLLTIYDREDGQRVWEVEREHKEIVTSNQGYGEVQTYCVTLKKGEISPREVKVLTILTEEGAVAVPFEDFK